MLDTGLDNELMALDTGFENSVIAAEQEAQDGQYVPAGYSVDQNGNFVNADMERVYYWVPSSELGDVTTNSIERALYQDTGGYYTEAEIRAAWSADEGMGYLKEQTDWDNYWGYLTERQGLIQDGTLFDATGADAAGRQARQDVIQEGGGLKEMGGAKGAATGGQNIRYEGYSSYYNDFLAQPEQMQLMQKYGISPIIQNGDGDVFGWNGSSYTKVVKVDDHNYGAIVGELIKSIVVSGMVNGISEAIIGQLATTGGRIGAIASYINASIFTPAGAGASSVANTVHGRYNNNLILNAVEEAIDVTDNPNGTQQEDGTTRYGIGNGFTLPPGYVYDEVKRAVIHTESGTEYPIKVSPWGTTVDLPPIDDEDAGGGGASSGDTSSDTNSTDTSTSTSSTTDAPSDTSGSSGGSPNTGGNNPNTTVISNETYGDVEIVTNPDVWSEGNTFGGWEIVSNTGVWGQSGISVIRNVASGMYQEIDWDNGTYNQEMQNNPNDNPFDTSGSNQGEGQGDDTESTADGTATGPTTETPPTEPTVAYPDNGSACRLPDGNVGVKKDGECIVTTNPARDIIGWPNISTDSSTGGAGSTDPNPNNTNSAGGETPSADSNNAGDDATTTGNGNNGLGDSGNNGDGKGNDGTGEGNGGNGLGDGNELAGNGNQWIDGRGGSSDAKWTRLYGQPKFASRFKEFQQGMFSSRASQPSSLIPQDYSNYRMGLLSQAYKDLS